MPPVTTRQMSSSFNDQSKTRHMFNIIVFNRWVRHRFFFIFESFCWGNFFCVEGWEDTQLGQWRSVCCHLSVVQVRQFLCFFSSFFFNKIRPFFAIYVLILSLGCVLSFDEVSSRTFASLLSACRHSCDMHKVLQEATERFRVRQRELLARTGCQFSCVEQTNPHCGTVSSTEPQRSWASKKL